MFAALNIRFLKSSMRNIGSAALISTNGNTMSRAKPAASEARTQGSPHPMDEVPYGIRAYVTPMRARVSPDPKVTLPQMSSL